MDEFWLLRKEKKGMQYMAPEALFHLDNAASQKTIYDQHANPKAPAVTGTPPPENKTSKNEDLIELINCDGDFTPQTSTDSSKSNDSSNNRLRSSDSLVKDKP